MAKNRAVLQQIAELARKVNNPCINRYLATIAIAKSHCDLLLIGFTRPPLFNIPSGSILRGEEPTKIGTWSVKKNCNAVTSTDGQHDWLAAQAAVRALSSSIGDIEAEKKLLSLLQRGDLEGRAHLLLMEADIGELTLHDEDWGWGDVRPMRHPRQRDQSRIEIGTDDRPLTVPSDFFARADGWVFDPPQISWPQGVIVARRQATFTPKLNAALLKRRVRILSSTSVNPLGRASAIPDAEGFMRRAVKGLMFRRWDIDRILRQPDSDPSIINAPKIAQDHFDWGPVLTELNRLIDNGQMSEKFGAIRTPRIIQKISLYVQPRVKNARGEHPSYETVRKFVRNQVHQHWIRADSKR